jgi:hypothetical protein
LCQPRITLEYTTSTPGTGTAETRAPPMPAAGVRADGVRGELATDIGVVQAGLDQRVWALLQLFEYARHILAHQA